MMEECKICGKEYKRICNHVSQIHNITSKEYYDRFFRTDKEGKCLECGKPTNFENFNVGYRLFCSHECAHKSAITKEKVKNTFIERYGVDNPAKSEEIKNKTKCTNLERYGAENVYASEYGKQKIKETNLKKYGVENASSSDAIRQKVIETNLERYGETNYTKTKEYKERVKKTNMEKYGKEYFLQTDEYLEKSKLTNLEKYGVERASQSLIIKAKIIQTNIERYGVGCVLQRQDVQAHSHSHETIQKQNETKKRNNTFNKSKIETELEIELRKVFPDLKTQYKSKEYPFNCDYYVPSLDLYIEYNGTWTHGGHFFDKNDSKDLEKLNQLTEKSKNSKFYRNAIETWTQRDILKLNTAIENNLNYIAWFNEEQAYDWIERIKHEKEKTEKTC
jgi:hypothetical protein